MRASLHSQTRIGLSIYSFGADDNNSLRTNFIHRVTPDRETEPNVPAYSTILTKQLTFVADAVGGARLPWIQFARSAGLLPAKWTDNKPSSNNHQNCISGSKQTRRFANVQPGTANALRLLPTESLTRGMHNIQQYGSSESEDDDEKPINPETSFRPEVALPSSKSLLQVTESSSNQAENDPSNHQGRIRSFAHERGIWASYVFVDYNEIDPLVDLQRQIINKCLQENQLELNSIEHLHLSLTKTFVLRHHNISAFVDDIRLAISGTKRFKINLSNLAIYVNDERTRTFLAVQVHISSYGPLQQLVSKLDECMKRYKLPEFYRDPSFHVSFLWALGDREKELQGCLDRLQAMFDEIYQEEFRDMNVNVRQLEFKCGNKFYHFDLL
ncbi:U6 snRNA phosphodiesterase 1 [Uranotaenia lowii]|uniref:U6 snRNA phosphodiesterase 1 n=1 Tax=Uranotaenia lowii TaxID=190385 RepID=UPI00247A0324|nr:U6 snRNA phosphodiesterase 1 [Uranotaenia lowii]